MSTLRSVAVVGGSLAAVSAVRALRAQGFDGAVTVLSAEPHLPYDRPPLSKSFLAGDASVGDLALLADGEERAADWRLGARAVALDPLTRSIELADGSRVQADGVVLATGARPRVPWASLPAGAHVLRTLEDAQALRAELVPGAHLVVVGAGFIGAEVASTARRLGLTVTVVDAAASPVADVLGPDVASALTARHALNGVRLVTGAGVSGFLARRRVEGVQLADGRELAADVVVVGAGAVPHVEWLVGSGLTIDDGIHCDAAGATALPGVVAVGDCAAWWDPAAGRHRRTEHWTSARERAAVAVATLLGTPATASERAPYVWSDQYGARLQVAGRVHPHDDVRLEEGGFEAPEWLAVYRRGGTPVAVAALGCARGFMRWRKQLAVPARRSSDLEAAV